MRKPELLAPAGDDACLAAAIAAGADAVYFGLSVGFNARARAANFTPETLPEIVARLHRAGVKGYLTLNTLVFSDELPAFEETARAVTAAGIDAVLVQDVGAARLIRAVCPDLPLHASTQMTLTSAQSIRVAQSLGLSRVVLARELSLDAIRRIRRETTIGLEVFVHGALCVSYSGQCLASLTFGGRSANRGQCAQACRLPYEMCLDKSPVERDGRRYVLSPNDLAALDLVPQLVAAGVDACKIEGRLKSAEYVATVTAAYRRAIDEAVEKQTADSRQQEAELRSPGTGPFFGEKASQSPEIVGRKHGLVPSVLDELTALQSTFSRGFCHGWLEGDRPHDLVTGRSPTHQGTWLGIIEDVSDDRLTLRLAADVQRGDGVAIVDPDLSEEKQGGRVYEIFALPGGKPLKQAAAGARVELAFGRDSVDFQRVGNGQEVYKTDDSRGTATVGENPFPSARRMPVDMTVTAAVGAPLTVVAAIDGRTACEAASAAPLAQAAKHALTVETLREQFGRLGQTPFVLRNLQATITGAPMAPLSVLNQLRRDVVAKLEEQLRPQPWPIAPAPALPGLRADAQRESRTARPTLHDTLPLPVGWVEPCETHAAQLIVLCRTLDQLNAALKAGTVRVIADLCDIDDQRHAVALARQRGAQIELATPRIQKPGEEAIFDTIAACEPDGILARNLGALGYFSERGIAVAADFSLNTANELSFAWLVEQGAHRVAAAVDLNRQRLHAMLDHVPAHCVEVVSHLHVPMFHTAHCLYCAALSKSSAKDACGEPCRRQRLTLRDRKGVDHWVAVDAFCRNTVLQAVPQSAAEVLPGLVHRGVGFYRIELPPHAVPGDVPPLLSIYRRLIGGELTGLAAWKELQRASRHGLTRGVWR